MVIGRGGDAGLVDEQGCIVSLATDLESFDMRGFDVGR